MTSIFAAKRISHAAAILAAGASIAFAVPANAAEPQTSARTQSAERGGVRADARRICVEQTTTGTRLSTRVCRTPAEWQAVEGFVPR